VLRRNAAEIAGPGRGANHVGLRAANERLVLSLIRSHGQLSKAQIAELSGLTAQTASVISRSLVEAGLLLAGAPVRGKVGQPFVPLTLNPAGALFLGLNLEVTGAQLALVDFTGGVVFEDRLDFEAFDAGAVLGFARRAVERARKRLKGDRAGRLQGIGISAGSTIGLAGNRAPAWPVLEDVVARLGPLVDLPVYLSGDAAAACSAELIYGLGSGIADFLYVFIDHTVSGGFVLNGHIRFARDDTGPNIGRTLVPGDSGEMVPLASLAPIRPPADGTDRRSLDALARGIAHAAHAAVSMLPCETVIIDGSLPPDMVHQATLAVRSCLAELDRGALPALAVREGSRWRKAVPLGAACLPLADRFFPESPAG
jgi:predicted NBD/HSP70 family sugar kinase